MTLPTDRLVLTPLTPQDARDLQEDRLPRPLVAGYPIDQLRSSARALLDHPGTRALLLVEREGEVIGFVAVDWDRAQPDLAIIAFIEIAASLQDQRYGREALAAVIRWAGERGAHRLVAEIPPENDRSKRLFMRAGFRRAQASSTRLGAFERWVWPPDLATEATQRRGRLQLVMSSPMDHEDVLRDIAPFHQSFDDQRSAPGRPTTHALMRLVEAVEADGEAIVGGRATQNLPELVELRHVANTFKTWSRDQLGAQVVRDISDPATYEHNVLVLSAHRLLHTWGNDDVRLVQAQHGRATCDLEIVVIAQVVGTELKTPDEMRQRRHISADEADAIAARVVRGSRAQRQGQAAFLLLIGGFQVPEASLVLVSTALEKELERSATRSNVVGAVALTVGRHADDLAVTVPRDKPFEGVYAQFAAKLNPDLFRLGVAARVARNSRYAGPVQVLRYREPGTGIHLP